MTDQVRRVRSFNRLVTQRVGALQEGYLTGRRSLGACRVLWEIGPEGTDVRSIRTRLGLDSGYLSRVLRSLEVEGLVRVGAAATDQRVRVASLTEQGRAERDDLDARSDDLATSMLEPLPGDDRSRLVEAMATVERLLAVGLVDIRVADPGSPAAQECLRSYFAELDRRFELGFDPAASISATVQELVEPRGLLLLAWLGDEPVGVGAVKLHGTEPAEIKRMWVADAARGLGVGRRLLRELETQALSRGAREARLETNRALTEAIRLYRTEGYVEVAPFNDEPYADHWFSKQLASER
jgi:DNA-binding MarR family transcriptional regulator/GNAT superfamily N-acetyltransferase